MKKNIKMFFPNKKSESGIALLIAVIFTSVVLMIGLTLGSLGYKQVLLASTEEASQNAFYAADAALECVLYADQQQVAFQGGTGGLPGGSIKCNGSNVTFSAPTVSTQGSFSWNKYVMKMNNLGSNICAKVVVYKTQSTDTGNTTYLFSSGYDNANCDTSSRATVRGIDMQYTSL